MNIIFQIDGGLGKNIMATAMVKVIKRRYRNSKLIVVSGYPDVFLNNPHVDETCRLDQMQGAYLKYIKDQKVKIFIEDPYRNTAFLTDQEHLLRTWCRMFGLNYNYEQPEIYLTQPEIDNFTPFYKTDKPILAMQPHGGPMGQGYHYSWTRDIPDPIVVDLINYYKDDYTIIHIKREDQKVFDDTLQALDNFRSIAILLLLSKKRLFIDSFAQHLAASLNLKSTVCWISTKPKIFGYSIHDNILANPFTKDPLIDHAIYQPFELSQTIHTIPYNDLNEVFNIEKITNSINKQ